MFLELLTMHESHSGLECLFHLSLTKHRHPFSIQPYVEVRQGEELTCSGALAGTSWDTSWIRS